MIRKAREKTENTELRDLAKALSDKFGEGSCTVLGDDSELALVKGWISTGNWALDYCISGDKKVGGFPVGRITELFGGFSSGKSLVISKALAECQKVEGIALLDDSEQALERSFAIMLGIDPDRLIYSCSDSTETAMDKLYTFITSVEKDKLGLYAWDSLASVDSESELEKDISDNGGYHTGAAKVLSTGFKKINPVVGKSNIAVVISNHLKEKFGITFGDKDSTPGGKALPFYASVRIRLSIEKKLTIGDKEDKDIIGVVCKAFVKKNKVSRPFKSCSFEIIYDKGVDYTSGCIPILVSEGIVKKLTGGFFEYNGQKYREKELEEYFLNNLEELKNL